MQSEPSTYLSTFMNQGHYLTKLLSVFVKILTDCKRFIDIRLSDLKDHHPDFSLCLNWFKRHVPRAEGEKLQSAPVCLGFSVHFSGF